jgi:2-keto-4-pentenoate hydratase/2-oxohepta-3-ene-1,7-dioic acid hydratase in catechol pathway
MRLCTFLHGASGRLGLVEGGTVFPMEGADVMAAILDGRTGRVGEPLRLDGLRLLAPHRPPKLLGIGLNYRDHAAETGAALPTEPLIFAKLPTAVTGPSGPVRRPEYTEELDYEGELAVVIGRRASRVPEARALDHVFGYAVMNDISARDRQRAEPQWVRAKGGDTFAPFGPWVTTADEVPDPQALTIRTWVNGDLRQDGRTADMVFGVAELIAYLSHSFTLEPGDVISTGTPAGVGVARTPKAFLQPGDTVRVEIGGIGAIEHPIE